MLHKRLLVQVAAQPEQTGGQSRRAFGSKQNSRAGVRGQMGTPRLGGGGGHVAVVLVVQQLLAHAGGFRAKHADRDAGACPMGGRVNITTAAGAA